MAGLIRSPLVIFAIAGLALFVLARAFGDPPAEDASTREVIVVEREALLDFVQLRSGEADAVALAERWDALDDEARQVWVDRFVREEALVREARRLGLDRDDDLIRRRLVQQMEFLVAADADEPIDDATLAAAWEASAEDHRVPAVATFAHVFVRDPAALAAGPVTEAFARAEGLRVRLNQEAVSFDGVGGRGDRFLYNRVYVDRTLGEIRAHFGSDMTTTLEALVPRESEWQGPVASEHGWHVILLRRRSESRLPSLDELRPVLAQEIRRERQEASMERGVVEILSGYPVRIEADVGSRRAPSPPS